jgi:hypothetical protein
MNDVDQPPQSAAPPLAARRNDRATGTSSERHQVLPFGFAPMLLISFLFGIAITFANGSYTNGAIMFVLLGVGLSVFCLIESASNRESNGRSSTLLFVCIWLGLVGIGFFATNEDLLMYPVRAWTTGRHALIANLVLLATYLPFLSGRWREPKAVQILRFAAFAVALTVGGLDVIKASPTPRIDVWTVQQSGAQALLDHKNPFQVVAQHDTGPRGGEDVPYVYAPGQLYVTLPAYWLGKDVRYTMLAALLLAGIGMRIITGRARTGLPSIAEDAPTLFMWLMTKTFFILEQAWIDPVQIMLITFTFMSYVLRFPSFITAALLGLVLPAKQTMFWAVGLVGVILRFNKRDWLTTIGVGGALILPFALSDFRALKYANFDFVNQLPARTDALTFNSWYLYKFGTQLPGSLGFLLAGIVAAFSMWRLRGSVGRLGIALTSTYSFFFAFNKWAFANYYFAVASLAALAAAASLHGTRSYS